MAQKLYEAPSRFLTHSCTYWALLTLKWSYPEERILDSILSVLVSLRMIIHQQTQNANTYLPFYEVEHLTWLWTRRISEQETHLEKDMEYQIPALFVLSL